MLEKTKVIQPRIYKDLKRAIDNGRFPHSILFSGNTYSGRLTAALECSSIILDSSSLYKCIPNIYLSLGRPYLVDVKAKVELYKKYLNNKSFSNLLDSFFVVVLLLSFASLREENGGKSILDKDNTQEFLSIFDILITLENPYEKSNEIVPLVNKALTIVEKIKNQTGFSIKDIRAFKEASELHTVNGNARIFIVEDLENAGNSAKNAFLKLLEEPPENTYFFIISKSKERLGETILSRLAPFNFNVVNGNEKNSVIVSYNEDGRKYDTIEDFFLSIGFEESAMIKKMAMDFAISTIVQKNEMAARNIILTLFSNTRDNGVKAPYLMQIFTSQILHIAFADINIVEYINRATEGFPYLYYPNLLKALNNAKNRVETYNQTIRNSALILMDDLLEL